jgi:hypothetical protein
MNFGFCVPDVTELAMGLGFEVGICDYHLSHLNRHHFWVLGEVYTFAFSLLWHGVPGP